MRELYELQEDACKIFPNSKRLEIINHFKDEEQPAGELLEKTGLSKANLSRHMGVLKANEAIKGEDKA